LSKERGRIRWFAAAALLVLGAGGTLWWQRSHAAPTPGTAATSGTLLDQMADRTVKDIDASGPVATNEQLEAQYFTILQNQRDIKTLRGRVATAASAKKGGSVKRDVMQGKALVSLVNLRQAAFEKDLAAARQARPNDPTVQWLTGELLLIVGGEPESILPYFNRATAGGLQKPALLASMAKVQFDLNQFKQAFETAAKAVVADPANQVAWEIYSRAGFGVERFMEVIQKLDAAFPGGVPEWAAPIERTGRLFQSLWGKELAQRRKDQQSGNLPQVRLTVEHRRFANAADSGSAGVVQSTGRGEVLLELFEDQAPATVSNFLHLTETGFFDETTFYWAEAGHMVVGGDPNTKNPDPSDDGIGGPGYVIPDEYRLPGARGHFRGTISTVQNGPKKSGSQFFITLIPSPEFDGNSTAFGRVIKGQDVIDQVTEGRTNREVGQFGKIIPGDRIVHAEVVRKRPHAYPVIKLSPGR